MNDYTNHSRAVAKKIHAAAQWRTSYGRRTEMRQTRWNPFGNLFNPLQQFQSEMNRLFDRWVDGGRPGPAGFPALNVWEDNEHVFVEAELPGVEFKDLEIYVTGGNELTLKGERKQP